MSHDVGQKIQYIELKPIFINFSQNLNWNRHITLRNLIIGLDFRYMMVLKGLSLWTKSGMVQEKTHKNKECQLETGQEII